MRMAGEAQLNAWPLFHSVNGTAEATTLRTGSVDFITAAQAFHWFDQIAARAEFDRILKPFGWVILIWNERRLHSTPFLRDYEHLLLNYGTDYGQVRHETVESEIGAFFSPRTFQEAVFENAQELDLTGFKGRVFSASYTPQPGDGAYDQMVRDLEELFYKHEKQGKVTIEYDTKLFYGRL
jgi:ubiquinone/menaquinone biosynthesis C-methylase UbiE